MLTYSSPRHFGVSPVLRRLLVPRHPPCALVHLTSTYFFITSLLSCLLMSFLFSFQGTTSTRCGGFCVRHTMWTILTEDPLCGDFCVRHKYLRWDEHLRAVPGC